MVGWELAGAPRAMDRTAVMPNLAYRLKKEEHTMWLILLEAGIALTILIGLVVWTMRGKK
jgi:hypothetical protein